MRADFTMSGPVWDNISGEGKDFVSNLLIVDPKERLNATGALAHNWLRHENQHSDATPSEDVVAKLDNSFMAYRETSTLKKLALNVSRQITLVTEAEKRCMDVPASEKGSDLSAVFPPSLPKVIAHNSRTDEIMNLRKTFQKYDTAKNGVLSFDEFKAALHESDFSDELLQEVFESIVSVVCCVAGFNASDCFSADLLFHLHAGRKQEWTYHVY